MILFLTDDAQAALDELAEAARVSGREAHAYLLGRTIRGKLVLRHVLPTPNRFAGAAIVQPDETAAQDLLAPYLAAGDALLGSAHIHFGLHGPSQGDLATLRSLADEFPGYRCIVVTLTGERTSTTCHSIEEGIVVAHDLQPYAYDTTMPSATPVLVLGAGSGVSAALLRLPSWGVPLTIVDGDRLEERNLARHILDRRSLGKPKATALRKLLRRRTNAPITALVEHVTEQERLAALIRQHALVLDCTGDVRIAHLTSQTAKALGVPSVHAGVYARGAGGYVFLNRPNGACIGCLQGLPRIEPQDNASLHTLAAQYGFTENEISAQAGLFTDISIVSALQAKVGLETLRSDSSNLPNLYLVNNTEISITRHHVAPSMDCLTCHPGGPA